MTDEKSSTDQTDVTADESTNVVEEHTNEEQPTNEDAVSGDPLVEESKEEPAEVEAVSEEETSAGSDEVTSSDESSTETDEEQTSEDESSTDTEEEETSEDDDDVDEASEEEPEEEPEPVEPPNKKRWYCVKVQSGREDSIKRALERRTKIEGLEEFVGQIIVPEERVLENRKGKRVTRRVKLYPGYLMVEVEYNDRVLYLFRETTGVGDFVGGSINHDPAPMSDQEVERMLRKHDAAPAADDSTPAKQTPMKKSPYSKGDRLRINDGTFAGMEAEVVDVMEDRSLVKLEVTIIGRTVEVDLEYWQVDPV